MTDCRGHMEGIGRDRSASRSGMQVLVSALSCNPGHGSEALVGYKYAEALARRHTVVVIASPPAQVPERVGLYQVNAGACNFNDVAPSPLARFELLQLPVAWRLNRRYHFDVVHRVTPSWIGNVSLLSAMRVPYVIGPLLASERPPDSFMPYLNRVAAPRGPGRWHPRRLAAGLASRARQVLARDHFHLRSARRILVGTRTTLAQVPPRFHPKCVALPYAGVEHDTFRPPPSRTANGPLRLLYAGRLVAYKGLELLLRAVAVAVRRCPLRLRVIGTGNPLYAAFCRQLVADLGLGHLVEFQEAVPRLQLAALYQEADVFCFPTLCDTYGVALLEAMSCACAVVVSDAAGPREIVSDATGITIALSTPERFVHDYADALVTLAHNAGLRAALGDRARQHIVEHHDWQQIAQRLLDIYDEL